MPFAKRSWSSTRAFGGFRSSAATRPSLSSLTSAFRTVNPEPTRLERTTGVPCFAAAESASITAFDELPSPTPASTRPFAPRLSASATSSAAMFEWE
jgi:hypothetical protein